MEMADEIASINNRSVHIEAKGVKEKNDWNEQTFFPFLEDRERHQVRIDQHAASFPKLGIGALVGALALIALSGAILLVIQGPGKVVSDWTVHVYKTHRYITIPKPAAWLSGILSGISVCFHIALSEGLNIAWWYHVRQENATVQDLHEIWGHGTSTWIVVKSGARDFRNGVVGLSRRASHRHAAQAQQPYSQRKNFSYVALATLFVATIPLNGFLLQNAVVVHAVTATSEANVTVPILDGVDFGDNYLISALPDTYDGGVTEWSTGLGKISQSVNTKATAVVDLGSYNTTCLDTCKATVPGAGFKITCTDGTRQYSILTDNELYNIDAGITNSTGPSVQEMFDSGTDVFSIAVTYHFQQWDRITVQTLFKDSENCTGEYSVSTCHLDLATVQYPVIINTGLKEATQNGLRNTTLMTLDMNLLTEFPNVSSVIPTGEPMSTDSTYPVAGVAGLFAQIFNSTVNLRYNNASEALFSIRADGLYAQQQLASQSTFTTNSLSPFCSNTFQNTTQQVLATMHSMMFQLSAYEALASYSDVADTDAPPSAPVRVVAVQQFQQNQYRVVWSWFFGAMAVTTVVAAFITPTFWGYWRLERRTTMSPFETARAFHAPMLYQEDATVQSDDLIKRVGHVQIHHDLPVLSVPSASGTQSQGGPR